MAVKRQNKRQKRASPYIQFSKKLITAVMLFWGLIRAWSVVAVWLNPDVGDTMATIVRGIDEIATLNVLSYTSNSISEKIALGYFRMKAGMIEDEDEDDDKDNESVG